MRVVYDMFMSKDGFRVRRTSYKEDNSIIDARTIGTYPTRKEAELMVDAHAAKDRVAYGHTLHVEALPFRGTRLARRTNVTVLRDTLANCGTHCVFSSYLEDVRPSVAYARGIVSGVVAGFMAQGMNFHQALRELKALVSHMTPGFMTGEFNLNAIPEAWQADWKALEDQS